MVLFNYATKELTAKVVYYGPGLCGKTTNLQHIYDTLPGNAKGKMLSLATKTDRTLFFDFLPIDLGTIRGMKTKIQLYTVPGQVFYDTTRKLVLKGADGVVFVADSQEPMVDANIDSFENLITNLKEQNLDIRNMPHVIQFNKRDMKNALPVPDLNERINRFNVPYFEAVAPRGDGVFETLKAISKLVLKNLGKKYGLEEETGGDSSRPTAPKPKMPNLPPKPKAAAPSLPTRPKPQAAPPGIKTAPMPEPTPAPAPPRPAPAPVMAAPPMLEPEPVLEDDDDELEIGGGMDEIEFLDDDPDASDDLANLPDEDEDIIEFDDDDFSDTPAPASAAKPAEALLKPIPSIDESEVIELDDEDPIEIEELDDMAEIAEMASAPGPGPSADAPDTAQGQGLATAAMATPVASPEQDVEPFVVPVSITLPTVLSGKPIRLQVDINFED